MRRETSYRHRTQPSDGWQRILELPIEERFAHRWGAKPICSFVWDDSPTMLEAGGATVAVHQIGPKGGTPVLSYHGNPGSARGPHPHRSVLEENNIRLIAFDAPGFGDSPAQQTCEPFVAAGHIAKDIITQLGYEQAAVFARSGGVPRALGLAALHPRMVSSMILVAGPAFPDADFDWYGNMTESNQAIFKKVDAEPNQVPSQLQEIAEALSARETALLEGLWDDLCEYDRMLFEQQPDLVMCVAMGHALGVANDVSGWAQASAALRRPWGLRLQDVRAPTLLVHGTEDRFATLAHARQLQSHIPGAELVEQQDGGHFTNWLQISEHLGRLASATVR